MTVPEDSLLKFEIPEVIYGIGSLSQIGNCCRRMGGERIFLVTDPGLIAAGWIDASINYLSEEDLQYVVYDNVVTNPRDFQVEQGAELYRRKNCDVIAAVGGGSPIDTAKGIGILTSNHGRIHEYEGANLVTQPIPPLVCAPSTAGTGADVSQFAVIANKRTKEKMTILSRAITPDITLVDPQLLTTKPAELVAATGMDTLTHAIEAFVSSLSWPMTDPHAIHAIELVREHLANATQTKDIEALEGMSIACLEAGMAFSNAILGAVHALAHPLGGLFDIHHGLANSLLLPVVIRENLEHVPAKFAKIARALGAETRTRSIDDVAQEVPHQVEQLIGELELPTRLSQVGVDGADIPRLAQMAEADICMLTNPHCYRQSEIEAMYSEVL
ncbi:MAG: iron-containing alcohol dehydrogenase [Desulfobacterales bacterium]|nr:iron-containing alcohol dehydrogenase [Desulfobacterales bacterium]